jgi:AraC-like DNA-binding protein
MRDFSRSGDFGEVRFFDVCIPSGKLRSTDRICMAGWHKVNGLYRQERKTGLPFGILLFTVGGTGSVCVDGKKTSVHAGEIALIPSGKAHSYMGTDDTWEFYWLHYLGDHAALCAEDITAQNDFVFNVGEKTVRMLTAELFGAKKQSIEQEIADSESLQNLMLLLLKRARIASADAVTEEMLRFLEEDAEDFSLDIFSEHFHYSKEHMIRLFHKNVGLSPYRYWLRGRLKRSCEELKSGDQTVEQIAARCGYRSVSAYSKQFKRLFGMSPSEYRVFFRQVQK